MLLSNDQPYRERVDTGQVQRLLNKEIRNQYVQRAYRIRDLEKSAADLFEKM